MKSQNTDTTRALGLLLILVLIATGSLAACNTAEEPAALPVPDASAGLDPSASYTPEKVRVQWLIADKTTVQQGGLDVQGAATFSGGSTLDSLTVSGATALDGGLTMDTTKFTVADTTGNVATAGTLAVAGLVSDSNGPFGINDATSITGTVTASGAAALNGGITVDTTNFTVSGTTGAVSTASTLTVNDWAYLNGGFSMAADGYMEESALYFDLGHKAYASGSAGNLNLTVPATSTVDIVNGGLTIAGETTFGDDAHLGGNLLTLDALENVSLYTGSLGNATLEAADIDLIGPVTAGSAIAANGGITVDTSNFTVNGTSGAVSTASTLTVDDWAYLNGGFSMAADGYMEESSLFFDLGHTSYINASAGNLNLTVPATSTVDIVNGGLTVAGDITVNGVKLVTASTGDLTLKAGASIYPTTAITNTGMLFTCAQSLVYTEVTAKGICVIPANANVVDAMLSVSTAFNGSGTDLVSCGYTFADPNELFDDISIATTAVGRLATTGGLGDIGATAKTVWCKYVDQNSDASTGAMTVLIMYVVD